MSLLSISSTSTKLSMTTTSQGTSPSWSFSSAEVRTRSAVWAAPRAVPISAASTSASVSRRSSALSVFILRMIDVPIPIPQTATIFMYSSILLGGHRLGSGENAVHRSTVLRAPQGREGVATGEHASQRGHHSQVAVVVERGQACHEVDRVVGLVPEGHRTDQLDPAEPRALHGGRGTRVCQREAGGDDD